MKGKFIISLDFELHWGVFDALSLDKYKNNLLTVPEVVNRLLCLSETYNVKLTFATVGFLFAENKKELTDSFPKQIPSYLDSKLNPYQLMDKIGENETSDSLHYAKSLIEQIKLNSNHEISTHTFSHYNCLADGQSPKQFDEDINAAVHIAKTMGIELKSIVFPKNQINEEHLIICKKYGITSYRGTEKHKLYNYPMFNTKGKRLLRLVDNYINISGSNTYPVHDLNPTPSGLINLPSSRFLRPYIPKLFFMEGLKRKRIKNAMGYAAKNNELFHLWWHPHNFGSNIDENFKNLEDIFKTYKHLNDTYNFESVTMTGLTQQILK